MKTQWQVRCRNKTDSFCPSDEIEPRCRRAEKFKGETEEGQVNWLALDAVAKTWLTNLHRFTKLLIFLVEPRGVEPLTS
jgi:hypothetical protein